MTKEKHDELVSLFTEAVRIKLTLSLLHLSNDLSLYYDNLPSNVKELKKELAEKLPEVIKTLKSSENDGSALAEKIAEIRPKVQNAARPVYNLMSFNELTEDLLIREQNIKSVPLFDEDKTLKTEFVTEILHNFLHTLHEEDFSDAASFIMSSAPCRLSRAKFAEYVERAIKADALYNSQYDPFVLEKLKRSVIPFSEKPSDILKDMYDRYTDILKSDVKNMSVEEVQAICDGVNKDKERIYVLGDSFSMIYSDINYIILMLLYGYDIDFVSSGNLIIKDLFYSAAEFAAKENPDEADISVADEINLKTENFIEDFSEQEFKVRTKIKKELEKFKDDETPMADDDSLGRVFGILQTADEFFSAELKNSICNKTEGDAQALAKSFIADFEEATAPLSPYVKKFLRQQTMAYLLCPYSVHELLDYITSVLKACEGSPAFFAAVREIIGAIDLFDKDEDSHDHGCGCGHHHEHDHDHNHDHHNCGHHHSHHFEKHL